MSTMSETAPPRSEGWFTKTEAWLDDKGKGAWIALMVLGFIFFWPVGLALLMYMIWSKRMFSKSCRAGGPREWQRHGPHMRHMSRHPGFRPTGNSAFDAYKAETLQRLMDEQEQFEAFLERLRQAKDKSEFDAFMTERAEAARTPAADNDDDAEGDAIVAKEPK